MGRHRAKREFAFGGASSRFAWERYVPGLVLALLCGVIGFAAGFNFHITRGAYYTPGFAAAPTFLPQLARAFWRFQVRSYVLADPGENKELVNQVKKIRLGIYRPAPDYRVPVYDGLKRLGLDVRIVRPGTHAGELWSSYDVLVFPSGGYRLGDLPDGERGRLRDAIGRGVGYIGICAGMIFAREELGIVDAGWKPLGVTGLVPVRIPVGVFSNAIRDRKLRMHYAGGGYFVAGALARWKPLIEADNLGVIAIQGKFGRGKVILFTAHPEGGGLTLNNQSVYFSGADLGTGVFLLEAIRESSQHSRPEVRNRL